MTITSVVTIDGNKYAVLADTYTRTWVRQFTFNISMVVTQVNFVDRGPGIRKYNMTLLLLDWPVTSKPYKDGVTASLDTQRTNLEASYNKVATRIQYVDPFGNSPTYNGGTIGVYFTNLVQGIPKYAVPNKVAITYDVELMDANGAVT